MKLVRLSLNQLEISSTLITSQRSWIWSSIVCKYLLPDSKVVAEQIQYLTAKHLQHNFISTCPKDFIR